MKIFPYLVLVITITVSSSQISHAQLNPLTAQYYNNTYLGNPAFAGYQKELTVNLSYRKQWGNIPGAPVEQNVTADYSKGKVGLGLNVNFDRAGLQRQSRVVATYAYHLPLNDEDQRLHFGVSLGFMNQRLASNDIIGESNDPLAVLYNERHTYLDGDFGIGYTTKTFRIEAALPNLNTFFKREEIKLADVATFYSAISYKFTLDQRGESIEIEPKLVYRGFKEIANIWDFGTELALADRKIMITGIYHSTKSSSFGLGFNYNSNYSINGFYTTQTSSLSSYSNGTFEINLKARF